VTKLYVNDEITRFDGTVTCLAYRNLFWLNTVPGYILSRVSGTQLSLFGIIAWIIKEKFPQNPVFWVRKLLGLPDPDPLVRDTDLDPDSNPSIINQKL
jgi:hypothetical protein